ncbi:hypothetical protein L873DRAFT_1799185 [Choiromyces venosus 120613-1]|uniref:Clr5 domain-containing protein n=1 Tax=Choiromyces venosus 120613-1 TaxID=1336337 RepID=A0A3N4K173_9PEZI|nr:hypothetical protein L873DRAFT_1799185 [Choiromyces venosus 120613-1]
MYQWEPVKEDIYRLYVLRNWSLRQVMEYFENNNYWLSSGEDRNPCKRSYRKKLAQWNYLKEADMKGKGKGGAGNSQGGSSTNKVNYQATAGALSRGTPQVLYTGGTTMTMSQPGSGYSGYQDTRQFDQPASQDGQFAQYQYYDPQDYCQDPNCPTCQGDHSQEEGDDECTCQDPAFPCRACVFRGSDFAQ